MDSDELRSEVERAELALHTAAQQIRNQEALALEDVGRAINAARKEIEYAVRTVLDVLHNIDDAKSVTVRAMSGSAQIGLVAEAHTQIEEADIDQRDMVQKLYAIKQSLDNIMTGILPVATRDKDNDAAKLSGAEAKLRGYRSTIP
jgi:hypothetical protein